MRPCHSQSTRSVKSNLAKTQQKSQCIACPVPFFSPSSARNWYPLNRKRQQIALQSGWIVRARAFQGRR